MTHSINSGSSRVSRGMTFEVKTKGHYDFIDITDKIAELIGESGIRGGTVNVFVSGSTCALTIMEYEEGIVEDFKAMLEKLAPEEANYLHHKRWGDHNGAAHLKSALIGTDLTIPIEEGKLRLGSWQQVVLIDFDERPREREIIVKTI